MCRTWTECGTCRYGAKCQFAHGEHELLEVQRHPRYKTELCRTFAAGYCPYGHRCRFIHASPAAVAPPPGAPTALFPATPVRERQTPDRVDFSPAPSSDFFSVLSPPTLRERSLTHLQDVPLAGLTNVLSDVSNTDARPARLPGRALEMSSPGYGAAAYNKFSGVREVSDIALMHAAMPYREPRSSDLGSLADEPYWNFHQENREPVQRRLPRPPPLPATPSRAPPKDRPLPATPSRAPPKERPLHAAPLWGQSSFTPTSPSTPRRSENAANISKLVSLLDQTLGNVQRGSRPSGDGVQDLYPWSAGSSSWCHSTTSSPYSSRACSHAALASAHGARAMGTPGLTASSAMSASALGAPFRSESSAFSRSRLLSSSDGLAGFDHQREAVSSRRLPTLEKLSSRGLEEEAADAQAAPTQEASP